MVFIWISGLSLYLLYRSVQKLNKRTGNPSIVDESRKYLAVRHERYSMQIYLCQASKGCAKGWISGWL
jgi:hypothetical protein